MKIRVRFARYQDVNHIEQMIQEALETPSGGVPMLPPVERPHIFNFLNSKISHGQIVIAIADEKLAGVGVVDGQTYPWNATAVVAVGYIFVRKAYAQADIQAPMLIEMASHAHLNNVPMIFQRIPGLDAGISDLELTSIGATIDGSAAIFLVPASMEKTAE